MKTEAETAAEVRAVFLEDVIVTALEGGIYYWAELLSCERHPADHPNRDRRGSYKTAQLRDLEGGVHTLDVAAIERGIALIAAPGFKLNRQLRGQLLVAAAEQDAGDIDATGADVLVQAGLLGELVYG